MTTLIGGIVFVAVCLLVGTVVAWRLGLYDDFWWWWNR